MFDWVKENKLPLTGLKLQILKLIGDLYGGKKIESGKQIWAPSMKAKNRRHVLIMGKGMVKMGHDVSMVLLYDEPHTYYIDEKIIEGGMIPKVQSCKFAIENGVESVHILDGRLEHSLLLEIFTHDGIGTMVEK